MRVRMDKLVDLYRDDISALTYEWFAIGTDGVCYVGDTEDEVLDRMLDAGETRTMYIHHKLQS